MPLSRSECARIAARALQATRTPEERRAAARHAASFASGSLPERFWSRVLQKPGCWEWTGAVNDSGYGRIAVRGRMEGAHRVSWELHHGPIPRGLWVLHCCDNPPCTNPAHLFLGTCQDNLADMRAKGRSAPNPSSLVIACPRGHMYDDANTRITPDGSRACRACDRERYYRRRDNGDPHTSGYRYKGRLLASETHCKFGHEFTPENTYVSPRGRRDCRVCIRNRTAAHRRRSRSEGAPK